MTKVAKIADIHLGLSGRHDDIISSLEVLRDYCADRSIDVVFILGDLFHDRQAVATDVMCSAYEFLKESKHKYNQNWIAFPGNHDMFLKLSWEVNSLIPLGEVCTLINTVKIVEVDGQRYWILPFIDSEASYMKVLRRIEARYKDGDILLTHIGACTAKKNICFLLQHWSVVDFSQSPFDRIYAGHFHLHQQVGHNLWYTGSLLPYKFDEGDSTHGAIIYDTDKGKHELVDIWDMWKEYRKGEVPPPQYRTILDTTLDQVDNIQHNLIRVATTRAYSQNEQIEVRDKLLKMGAKSVMFADMATESNTRPGITIEETKTDAVQIGELFGRYFDEDKDNTVGLRRNLAIKLNLEIMQEGDELYEARQNP